MKRILIHLSVLFMATAAIAQQSPGSPVSSPTSPGATASPGTPKAKATGEDPVVAAAQRSAEMHAQAADAAREALAKAKEGPLSQAQRHLLMAAALLYNSSAQLERVARKELMRAETWQATGEQKERASADMDEEQDRQAAQRQGKSYVAYGTTQATIAESMLELATRQAELAKEAEAAGKATTNEPLEKSAKSIIDENKAAKSLAAGVRETRAKLDKLMP